MAHSRTVMVDIGGQRYLATGREDHWQRCALDAEGAVIDGDRPSALAVTAGEAWVRGVSEAAPLPIDEMVVVAADADGQLSHHLLSGSCPLTI